MKTMLKKPLAIAIAASAMTAGVASAEVTGSLDVSSAYLFRGVSLSAPQVSGSLDWSAEMGLYAGVWASNLSALDTFDATENDYYLGFSGGDSFTFDVGLIQYRYPLLQDDTATFRNEAYVLLGSEFGLGFQAWLGYGDCNGPACSARIGGVATAAGEKNKNQYYVLSYDKDAFGVLVGYNDNGLSDDDAFDYTHIDLSYGVTDNLTMTATSIVSSTDGDTNSDLAFVVSYGFDI